MTVVTEDGATMPTWDEVVPEQVTKKARKLTRPTIVSIEGIPGSRKSDIIDILQSKYDLEDADILVLQEPIIDSLLIRDSGGSLLEHYFKNPTKYGLPFQIFYFLAVEKQIREAIAANITKRVIICERSLLAAKHVFMPMLYDNVTKVQQEVYNQFFENGGVRHAMPDEVIYLKVDIEKCEERVKDYRDAQGNEVFTRKYLEDCEILYNREEMKINNTFREIVSNQNDVIATVEEITKEIGK